METSECSEKSPVYSLVKTLPQTLVISVNQLGSELCDGGSDSPPISPSQSSNTFESGFSGRWGS